MGDVPKAIEMISLVVRAKPLENGPKNVLGHLLIAEGGQRWLEGWRLTNEEFPKLHQSAFAGEVPTWNGDALGDRRLFVYQDQGAGDALLSLRFLPMLAARKVRVVLWVTPAIADLARTVAGEAEFHTSSSRPDARSLNCAAAVPLFGLPAALGLQPSDLKSGPLVTPDSALCATWKDKPGLSSKINIGLVAMGNPWRNDDWMRSIPCADLAPLKRYCEKTDGETNVQWVNLAVDDRRDLGESIDMLEMLNPAPGFRSFADTAAAIAALDAVVAIDCSVAHLAAAMGKRVWVLVPPCIEWRWRIGSIVNPWWPTATVLQCEQPGKWQDTIAKLTKELDEFVEAMR